MSIYAKLAKARIDFHALDLKKSGLNKFAGYKYFELSDFVIPALNVFQSNGLLGFVSFNKEIATLRIVETEGSGVIEITSPMSSAALKGAHEIQNLGAVQTYLRRYLWVAALEIVEHDAVDSSDGASKEVKGKGVIKPTDGAKDGLSKEVLRQIELLAKLITSEFYEGVDDTAYQLWIERDFKDVDESTALWGMLDSKVRSFIKSKKEKDNV
jgi:hypothetical protein